MSVGFRAVQWSRTKLVYDAVLLAGVVAFVGTFYALGAKLSPPKDELEWIDLRIRAFGACAFLMLTIILAIGPLARIDRKFLPLLYNRRHFGVATFCVAALHAAFMLEWYGAQGTLPSLVTELTTWADYAKFIGFPFKTLGILALALLFLLAATSHDYWLAFLTARAWKALHMMLYVAYGLVVLHVALGIMQFDRHPAIPLLFGGAFAIVTALHLIAGWREREPEGTITPDGWIVVGTPYAVPDQAARIVTAPGGERIAVFRDGRMVGALTNLCAHQQGPLGEGRIVGGCVTCPWHGWQYRLADGCAPEPFTEKLATYAVRLRDGVIEVDPKPLAPGTPAAIMLPADQAAI